MKIKFINRFKDTTATKSERRRLFDFADSCNGEVTMYMGVMRTDSHGLCSDNYISAPITEEELFTIAESSNVTLEDKPKPNEPTSTGESGTSPPAPRMH